MPHVKVIVVLSEGIEQCLCHLVPTQNDDELDHREHGNVPLLKNTIMNEPSETRPINIYICSIPVKVIVRPSKRSLVLFIWVEELVGEQLDEQVKVDSYRRCLEVRTLLKKAL